MNLEPVSAISLRTDTIWASVLVIGACSGLGVIVHGIVHASLAAVPRITARWGRVGRAVERGTAPIIRCHDYIFDDAEAACGRIFQLYLGLLSVPMCIAGTWLGILVIAGQGKKSGSLNFLTAMILLFDVGFKIGATVFVEIWELYVGPWRRRRTQRMAEARRAAAAQQPQDEAQRQLAAGGGSSDEADVVDV